MPFFSLYADDLNLIIRNLNSGRYSHIKTGVCEDLLLSHLQVTCYRILNALYVLGTTGRKHANRPKPMEEVDRHRQMLGVCLAALTTYFPVAFLEPEMRAY
ncbi:unnamed protein product, partial [Taenia asiatica]|uniref:Reverse transcriptase domain-containing protein n=1 Tax=Taenia asiatica TaxID=60517 RepID=A0A0R3WGX4_TAEAS